MPCRRMWTPQQLCYRNLMRSLRDAYFHDRAKLFWARHRVRVEFYKYRGLSEEPLVEQLTNVGNEIADFVSHHMKTNVERIVQHNERMLQLPVAQAKRFHREYFEKEREHESWCRQRIKRLMNRRPPPPYPYS